MNRGTKKPGFVLLMVLVVLVIAGTILAVSARRNCERALQAGIAQQELQLRWGFTSCEAVCLPAAERILKETDASGEFTPIAARCLVKLGRQTFHLIVSDEQAKANVNFLAQLRKGADLARIVRELEAGRKQSLRVELKPTRMEFPGTSKQPTKYISLDQVFVFQHPSELIALTLEDAPAPNNTTCWGSGCVNFRSARISVLQEVLKGLLTHEQVHKLDKFRNERPDCTLVEVLQHLQLSDKNISQVKDILTDVSRCHSLWIVAEGDVRNWYRLYVSQNGDTADNSQRWVFAW